MTLILKLTHSFFNFYRPGTSSQRIWMKDVVCSADTRYECVATCKTCPVGVDNTISSCDHSTDMTIRCGKSN